MKQNGSLLNETFFRLLEECVTWNPSVDVNKMNEGTYIVDCIGPLFNKTIHYFNYVTIHSWYEIILCVLVDFYKKGLIYDCFIPIGSIQCQKHLNYAEVVVECPTIC